MKATKESVLYVHKQGTDYECTDCAMFLFRLLRCTVHRSKDRILPFGSCGFWVFGNPLEFGKPEGSVTPLESGYVESARGFSCKRCRYFLPSQMACMKVDENSGGDDFGMIHPDACCNAWRKENNSMKTRSAEKFLEEGGEFRSPVQEAMGQSVAARTLTEERERKRIQPSDPMPGVGWSRMWKEK